MDLTTKIGDMLDRLGQPADDELAWEVANTVASELGAVCITMGDIDATGELLWMRSSMSQQWLSDYVSEAFYEVDPFLRHSAASRDSMLLEMGYTGSATDTDPRERELDNGLRLAGYDGMYYQPFRMEGGLLRGVTFGFDNRPTDLTEEQTLLMRLAMGAVANRFGPRTAGNVWPVNPLSQRESEVLQLLAAGFQNMRIAERLGIAEVTVRAHLTSARRKLRASTREQALAIALERGFVGL